MKDNFGKSEIVLTKDTTQNWSAVQCSARTMASLPHCLRTLGRNSLSVEVKQTTDEMTPRLQLKYRWSHQYIFLLSHERITYEFSPSVIHVTSNPRFEIEKLLL